MKDRYRLVRRRKRYYAVDRHSNTRESLETDSLRIARRLLVAKNEAAQQTNLNLLIGRTYLGANDPNMVLRSWQFVMDEFCGRGKEHTKARRERAMRMDAFAALRSKKLVETNADDLRSAPVAAHVSDANLKVLANPPGWRGEETVTAAGEFRQ